MRAVGLAARIAIVVAVACVAVPLRAASEAAAQAYAQALEALHRDSPEEAFALVADGAKAGDPPSMFLSGFLQQIGAGAIIEQEKSDRLIEAAAAKGHVIARRYLAWKMATGTGEDAPDPDKAAKSIADLPTEFEIGRGLSRWLTVKDGMCEPRWSVALYWMMDRAGDENPIAESNLATVFYGGGWGQAQDMGQHLYWLRRAADRREPNAMLLMALYLGIGALGEPDPARELELLRGAAEAGLVRAQAMLAERLRRGDGVEKDLAAAAGWLRKAADQGDVEAMEKLGDLLRAGGEGLERDFEAALEFSRMAADRGSIEALSDVANMIRLGQGTTRDIPEATRLYEKAAEGGNAHAASMVGWLAISPEPGQERDYARARVWFEKAAEAGNGYSMRELGRMYEAGNGVGKSAEKAFEWFERAGRDGDAWSQNRLGWMLRQGIGVEKDDEEAVTWFKLAAKNGMAIAHGNLAYHYLRGEGVPRDMVKAFEEGCLCLREIDDEWTRLTVESIFGRATEDEAKQLIAKVEEMIAGPDLMKAEGTLPEALLEAVGSMRKRRLLPDPNTEKILVERLIEADRPSSQLLLAWRHFLGAGVPFDLEKARRYVRRAIELRDAAAPAMEAQIEIVCAETEEARDSARKLMRELAEAGDRHAARQMFNALWNDNAATRDEASAIRFFRVAARLPPGMDDEQVRSMLPVVTNPVETRMSAEEFAELKARVPSNTDRPPVGVFQAQPRFPFELSREGIEGFARVRFVVDREGVPVRIQVVDTSHPLFGREAVEAVGLWRFAPGIKGGEPVATNMEVPLRFTLSDEPSAEVESILERLP